MICFIRMELSNSVRARRETWPTHSRTQIRRRTMNLKLMSICWLTRLLIQRQCNHLIQTMHPKSNWKCFTRSTPILAGPLLTLNLRQRKRILKNTTLTKMRSFCRRNSSSILNLVCHTIQQHTKRSLHLLMANIVGQLTKLSLMPDWKLKRSLKLLVHLLRGS